MNNDIEQRRLSEHTRLIDLTLGDLRREMTYILQYLSIDETNIRQREVEARIDSIQNQQGFVNGLKTIANLLGISPAKLYRLREQGVFDGVIIGREGDGRTIVADIQKLKQRYLDYHLGTYKVAQA